jgi:hypothetical protein
MGATGFNPQKLIHFVKEEAVLEFFSVTTNLK